MFIKLKRGGKWFINVCTPILLSLCLAISPLSVSATTSTYNLIYNANGGTGAPVTQPFSPDTGDIQVSRTTPTLKNYVFLGWSRTPTGAPDIQPLSKVSTVGVSANITLYAKWGAAATTRYVYFTGSTTTEINNVSNLPVAHYYTYDASSTIVLSDVVPIRKYHTFLGWTTVRSSNTVEYMPGDTYSCSLASAPLFPVWSYDAGSTPIITLDKLSNPTATGIPDSIVTGEDGNYYIPEATPVKTGSTFAGWSTVVQNAYSAFTDLYLQGEQVPIQDDTVLYPYFIASTNPNYSAKRIYVTYALNGGVDGPVVQYLANNPVNSAVYYDFYISSKIPKKDGFTFIGWSRSLNGPVALLAGATTNFKPQTSFTLYAVWQALPVETPHTLTFDANGGLNPPASIPYSFNTNTQRSLYLPTEIPTLEGKDFVGWSTVKGSATAQYLAGSSWTLINKDTTLYAVWADKPIIRTITYNANGGTNSPDALSYVVKPTGTVPLSTVVPVKEGYEFLGWSKTQSSISAEYPSGYAWSLSNNYDTVLYAIWKVIPTYTITYDANGGTDAPGIQSYLYNKTGTTNLSLIIPKRVGYTFEGWSTTSNGSSGTIPAGGTWHCSNVSTILYAQWKIIPITYTITYDANGGINPPASQSYQYNSEGYMLLTSATPTRESYTFSGWARTPDAVNAEINPSSVWYYSVKENTTLYAVWKFVQPYYTISYNTNGGTGSVASRTYQHETDGDAKNIFDLGAYSGSKTGYKFIGWSRDSQAKYPEFFPEEHWDCTREGNILLYAVWINQRGVKFNLNGGSLSGVTDGEIKYGALGSSFYIPEVPHKEGYTFRGWVQQGRNGIGPWGEMLEMYDSLDFTTNLAKKYDVHTEYHTASFGYGGIKKPDDCQMKDGYFVHQFYWTSSNAKYGVFTDVIELDSIDTNKPFFGYSTIGSYFRCTLYAKIPTGYSLFLPTSIGGHHFIGTGEYEFYEYQDYFANGQGAAEESLKLVKRDNLLPYPTAQNPVSVEIAYLNGSKSDLPESGLLGVGMGNYTFNALGIDSLTAIYDEEPYPETQSFSILYNSMGGSTVPDVQTYKYSLSDSIALSSTIPTKANYTFLGWSKDKLATSAQYQAGSDWSCSHNSSTILYAVWREGTTSYTLSYNPNGGINAPTDQPYVYSAGGSMLLSTNIPIKTGFKFMGWSTDVNATVAEFQPGDSWSLSSSPTTTLYAVWQFTAGGVLTTPKTLTLDATTGKCTFKLVSTLSTGTIKVSVPTSIIFSSPNRGTKEGIISLSSTTFSSTVKTITGTVSVSGLTAGTWTSAFNIGFQYVP